MASPKSPSRSRAILAAPAIAVGLSLLSTVGAVYLLLQVRTSISAQNQIVLAVSAAAALAAGCLFAVVALRCRNMLGRIAAHLSNGMTSPVTEAVKPRHAELRRLCESIDSERTRLVSGLDDVYAMFEQVDNTSQDLNDTIGITGNSVTQIIELMETVHINLEVQSKGIEETTSTVQRMQQAIEQIERNVENQSSAIEESSASIEEMVSSIHSVQGSTETAKSVSVHLETIAREGGDKISAALAAIGEMQTASEKIAEAIEGITNIADTTNLLSMNAAIESAHAGTAGKGFSVVADEIRKLATDAADEARIIKNSVEEVVERTSVGAEVAEAAGAAFKSIMNDIDKSVDFISEIAGAMSQQSAGASEILSSVQHLVEQTSQIRESVQRETEGSRQILETMQDIHQGTQEVLAACGIQMDEGKEVLSTQEILKGLGDTTRLTVDRLREKLSQMDSGVRADA